MQIKRKLINDNSRKFTTVRYEGDALTDVIQFSHYFSDTDYRGL